MAKSKIEVLAKGRHLQLVNDGGWEYATRVQGTGVVAIVAVTSDNELVLTEQFRRPVNKKVIDLPAGLSGDIVGEEGEEHTRAAQRELFEETGYKARELKFIATCPTTPGMVSEEISLFLARDVKRVGAGGGDESEDIKVHVVPLDKIIAWLARKSTKKTCIDMKVYAALGILAHS